MSRDPKPRLRRSEASAYLLSEHGLEYTPETLARLATRGGGPLYQKIAGGRVFYLPEELDRWANQKLGRLVASTAEYPREVETVAATEIEIAARALRLEAQLTRREIRKVSSDWRKRVAVLTQALDLIDGELECDAGA